MEILGLGRASYRKDEDPKAELLLQKKAAQALAVRLGYPRMKWVSKIESTKFPIHKRPTLVWCLDQCAAHRYAGIVCSKQNRICRNVEEFNYLNNLAMEEKWLLRFGDVTYDWTKARERGMARMGAVVDQMIREMTSEAMADWVVDRREKGLSFGPKRGFLKDTTADLIMQLDAQGKGTSAIATILNNMGEPTIVPATEKMRRAYKWHARSVENFIDQRKRDLAATESLPTVGTMADVKSVQDPEEFEETG